MPKPITTRVLLDSGAFTAWTSGKQVDLTAYIKYCQENAGAVEKAVNLDVIPGSPGQARSPAMVEASAAAGWKNLLRMRKEGVDALPVFHFGERLYWLDKMIGEGCPWIGLASNAMPGRVAWLDKVWSHLCAKGGYPPVRVHGFLETNLGIMLRYPWYSVDSSTWIRGGAFGRVLVDVEGRRPMVVFFGPGEMKRGYHSTHYIAQPARTQEKVRKAVEALGFTIEQLSHPTEGRDHRAAFYATFFLRRLKDHRPPKVQGMGGLWGAEGSPHGRETPLNERVRFFFAVSMFRRDCLTLNRVGGMDRLLSYAYLSGAKHDLAAYARTGLPAKVRERL